MSNKIVRTINSTFGHLSGSWTGAGGRGGEFDREVAEFKHWRQR